MDSATYSIQRIHSTDLKTRRLIKRNLFKDILAKYGQGEPLASNIGFPGIKRNLEIWSLYRLERITCIQKLILNKNFLQTVF